MQVFLVSVNTLNISTHREGPQETIEVSLVLFDPGMEAAADPLGLGVW